MIDEPPTVEIDGEEIDLSGFNAYEKAILEVFAENYEPEKDRLIFSKDELVAACTKHGIVRNVPDVVYSFRSRKPLPGPIRAIGHWAIGSQGKGVYTFERLESPPHFDIPFEDYAPIDIYNSVPEVVQKFLRDDEQSLLTNILYNRLIDIFTETTCFHLQNHYRATIDNKGQVEIDSLYVGVDSDGELYAIPIEAKSARESDEIGRVQVSQLALTARQDFPDLGRRILAVKEMTDGTIAVVEFTDETDPNALSIEMVRRFRLIRD